MRSHRFHSLLCWYSVVSINQVQLVRITAVEDEGVARDRILTAVSNVIQYRGQRAGPLPSVGTSRPCAINSRRFTNIETLNEGGCSGNHFRGGFPRNNHFRGSDYFSTNKQTWRRPRSANQQLSIPTSHNSNQLMYLLKIGPMAQIVPINFLLGNCHQSPESTTRLRRVVNQIEERPGSYTTDELPGSHVSGNSLADPGPFAVPPQKDSWVGHAADHAEPNHPRGAKFSQKIKLNPQAEPFTPRSIR